MLFTRTMKCETHCSGLVLTRRKTTGGTGIRLVPNPNVTHTAGCPWQHAQGTQAGPGTPELCAGGVTTTELGVNTVPSKCGRRDGAVTVLCPPHHHACLLALSGLSVQQAETRVDGLLK